MCPRLIVSNYSGLDVAPRGTRAGLVTVALAALTIALAFGAELLGHPTEAEFGAADIQGTCGACGLCKLTAFVRPGVSKVILGGMLGSGYGHSACASQLLQHTSLGDWPLVPQASGP